MYDTEQNGVHTDPVIGINPQTERVHCQNGWNIYLLNRYLVHRVRSTESLSEQISIDNV